MMRIEREDAFAELVELLTRHHVDDELPFTFQTPDHLSADATRVCKNDPAGLLSLIVVRQCGHDRAFPRGNVKIIGGLMPSRQRFSVRTRIGRVDPVPPSLE